MKICIVRHGSAVAGENYDMTRQLTERGQQQAQAAGHWLSGLVGQQLGGDTQLFASPYVRTQQTAAALAQESGLSVQTQADITPDGDVRKVLDFLLPQQQDCVIVSHLPLVGHLAAMLVDGQAYDQPWSPAECWLLEGDLAAPGCMTVTSVWYPALEGI